MSDRTLDADAAAKRLGISRSSLYSYVSRGLIRSEPAPDRGTRSRRYAADDVERLLERKRLRRDPDRAGERSLAWGMPVVDSAVTLIDGGRLFYRGRDAVELADGATLEEVAALLWTGDPEDADRLFSPNASPAPARTIRPMLGPETGPIERCQAVLPLAGAADPAAWDLRPVALPATGARVLRLVAECLAGTPEGDTEERTDPDVAGRLVRGWSAEDPSGRGPSATRLVTTALVLCADHELNVSAFTARCVASAEGTLYDAVAAGLAALKGRRHGGATGRVAALLREVGRPEAARATLAARLRRGDGVPGFGHPLYPEGDPRGAALLRLAREAASAGDRTASVEAVVEAADELLGERPTLDVGLVAVARALELPEAAPLALFTAGRTAGWIAHAIEEAERGRLIRPRARYTGPQPTQDP